MRKPVAMPPNKLEDASCELNWGVQIVSPPPDQNRNHGGPIYWVFRLRQPPDIGSSGLQTSVNLTGFERLGAVKRWRLALGATTESLDKRRFAAGTYDDRYDRRRSLPPSSSGAAAGPECGAAGRD